MDDRSHVGSWPALLDILLCRTNLLAMGRRRTCDRRITQPGLWVHVLANGYPFRLEHRHDQFVAMDAAEKGAAAGDALGLEAGFIGPLRARAFSGNTPSQTRWASVS